MTESATDYFEKITKAMALKEVNDDRMNFLKSMSQKASDDKAFQNAVNNIISTYESSYGTAALEKGTETMLLYSFSFVWDLISEGNPIIKACEVGGNAMDAVFNFEDVNGNNIRIIMQYTAGQYAQQVLNSAYYAYKANPTEKNAATFNGAYKNYLAYQDYSSEWAKNFVEAVPFASSTTVDAWLSDLNSDINYCNSAISFAKKYTEIYDKAVYTSSLIPTNPDVTTPNNPTPVVTTPAGTAVDIIESGDLGDDVHYSLYENGYLYIYGNGQMKDFNSSPIVNKKLVKEVSIVKGITSIGNWAFRNCTSLTNIIIPDSVMVIEVFAFDKCTGLTSIIIPDSMELLCREAFDGCTGSTSITILNKDCNIYDSGLTISTNAVIYGYTNSTAQTYAEKYNREFVSLDGPITTTSITTATTTTSNSTTSTTTTSTTTTSKQTTSTTTTSTTTTSKQTTSTTTTSTTTTSKQTTTTKSTTTTIVTSTINTTTAPETTAVSTDKYFASIAEMCDMAKKDYKTKNNVYPDSASAAELPNGSVSIKLFEADGELLDTYMIDPVTGIGISENGSSVNLPQTGNNSCKTAATASAALVLALLGLYAVVKSGVLRKAEDEK